MQKKIKKILVKILYIIPVFICLAFIAYFDYVSDNWSKQTHAQLHAEKVHQVDALNSRITRFVQRDQDWDMEREFYIEWITWAMEDMDAQMHTLALVANQNLEVISTRDADVDEQPLDPFVYQVVVDAVSQNDSGEVEVDYNGTPLVLYYRWVPDIDQSEKYLLVIGISPRVTEDFYELFYIGVALMSLTVALMQAVMVGYVSKVRGDK